MTLEGAAWPPEGWEVAERDEPVPMQRTLTLKVLPEYVNAYLDEGWTVIESETKGARND